MIYKVLKSKIRPLRKNLKRFFDEKNLFIESFKYFKYLKDVRIKKNL